MDKVHESNEKKVYVKNLTIRLHFQIVPIFIFPSNATDYGCMRLTMLTIIAYTCVLFRQKQRIDCGNFYYRCRNKTQVYAIIVVNVNTMGSVKRLLG